MSEKANNGGCVIFGLIGSPAWAEWEGGLGGLPETPGRTVWQLLAEIRWCKDSLRLLLQVQSTDGIELGTSAYPRFTFFAPSLAVLLIFLFSSVAVRSFIGQQTDNYRTTNEPNGVLISGRAEAITGPGPCFETPALMLTDDDPRFLIDVHADQDTTFLLAN